MNYFSERFNEGELAAILAFITEYEAACKELGVQPTMEGMHETAIKAIKQDGKKRR